MSDRQAMIAAATKYLDALVSHNGADVPLAPDCWRTEEGKNSGTSAEDIRVRLSSDVMAVITGYRDLRWWIDGDDAIAFYVLDAGPATTFIAERFRVIEGLIHEIEAIFFISPEPGQHRWPNDPNQVWTAANTPSPQEMLGT